MFKVSVVITNFNLEKYIGACLRSCLNQTLPKDAYELIIVDDCSTDNSVEVIKELVDSTKVKLITLEKNHGVSYASNVGVRKAQAPYVIRVDADDYINENLLLFFSTILDWNSDISFVYGDVLRVNEGGTSTERINLRSIDNLFDHGAGIMFRKSCLEAVGLYDENLKNCEDFDLIKRLFKNFDGYYVKLPLYRYRLHTNNMTNNKEDREKWRAIVNKKT